jgi:hypothetical protein
MCNSLTVGTEHVLNKFFDIFLGSDDSTGKEGFRLQIQAVMAWRLL